MSTDRLASPGTRRLKSQEFHHFADNFKMTPPKGQSRKLHRSYHFMLNVRLIDKFTAKALFLGSRQEESQVK